MIEEVTKIEDCLNVMKECLEIPNVGNCICFADAFKVLISEINELYKKIREFPQDREKIILLKKEIEEIKKIISKGGKECLGCNNCRASVVFKSYPDKLDALYLDNDL